MAEQTDSLPPLQQAILQVLQENAPGGTLLPQVLNYLYTVSGISAEQLLREIGPTLVLMYERALIDLSHPGLRWGSGDESIPPLFIKAYKQGLIWDAALNQWAVPEIEEKPSWQVVPNYTLADVAELVTKGYTALEVGLHDKAETCWITAIQLDPNNEQALSGLARAASDPGTRCVFLNVLRTLNPNNLTVQQNDLEAKE